MQLPSWLAHHGQTRLAHVLPFPVDPECWVDVRARIQRPFTCNTNTKNTNKRCHVQRWTNPCSRVHESLTRKGTKRKQRQLRELTESVETESRWRGQSCRFRRTSSSQTDDADCQRACQVNARHAITILPVQCIKWFTQDSSVTPTVAAALRFDSTLMASLIERVHRQVHSLAAGHRCSCHWRARRRGPV